MVATGGHGYTEAYGKTAETGQPLVILIGADWCPGCRTMKNSVIPQLEKQGGLNKVAFAYVNADHQRDLAGKLMQGGSIPQLVVFRKTAEGNWTRQQLTGAHSIGETQSFLGQGAVQATTKQTSSK
jgi:thiol-disulfide isomerase/thioredoxin